MRLASSFAIAAAAVLCAPHVAQAAIVSHSYTPLGGTDWAVDFSVTNDGSHAFAGFTVYFPDSASNLALAASPAGWDSIVVQPDSGLPAPGFFDTFADTVDAPMLGEMQAGFRVTFDWTGVGDPGRLRVTVNDANFTVLADGLTVPEPTSALLAALGLGALLLGKRRGERKQPASNNTMEICA